MGEEPIFIEALDKEDPAERAAFLDRVCADSPPLRQRIERLLRQHEQADDFLESPAGALVTTSESISEGPGTVIGPYKLLEQIGEGGFGFVFMAEQQHPVRRKVALKVLKPGMDSHQVIARFEAERQALALMDHPHIAKVFDAGTTDAGRPYFVMELVKGTPITKYCDEHRLTPRQRLELFVPVCQAIQHAHQKGIIHRDIKPSNVMAAPYDGKPVVKVIDFGVAKATGQRLTDRTLFTGFGAVVGTLEYMSPEQAELNNQDIDTRSDIYSLGVLLYELLTGTTPLTKERLKNTPFAEVLRLIREEDPPRPSTRLGASKSLPSISAQRQTEPAKLRKLVRGELDWIVLKALDKDRARRYETANGLARDIERYLNDEPVEACPPSASYRLKKFARKYKRALATASVFVLLLVVAVAALGVSNVQISEAKNQAEKAREEERKQRRLAEEMSEENRQYLHPVHLIMAQKAWNNGEQERAIELLRRVIPLPGQADVRGFTWRYLWNLWHSGWSALLPLSGHKNDVLFVTFSPDGQTLATASKDKTVRLWEAATSKELALLQGHLGEVNGVAFSPDGKTLATASNDGFIKLWDVATKKERTIVAHFLAGVECIAFSPDGKTLASGGDGDRLVKLWDPMTGKQQGDSLAGHSHRVYALAFSPDGRSLASASNDQTVKLWNLDTRKERDVLRGHSLAVRSVAFSHDGKRIVTGSEDKTLRVWNATTGQEIVVLEGHNGWVQSVAFSPDDKTVVSGSTDMSVGLWDLTLGKARSFLIEHTARVWCVAFNPDGTKLATASGDRTVKLWDLAKTQGRMHRAGNSGAVMSVSFSPDSKTLAIGSSGRETVNLLDLATRQVRPIFEQKGEAKDWRDVVALGPDGKMLACGRDSGGGWLLNLANKRERITFEKATEPIYSLAFSPDGLTLATGEKDGMAKVWDVATGRQLAILQGHTREVLSVVFSPDRQTLATASRDGTIKLWEMATWKERNTPFLKHLQSISCLAFSPDGKTLATASNDKTVKPTVKLWDLVKKQERATLAGHGEYVSALAFSPDGKTLATGSHDTTVKLWDPVTGQELITLEGHTSMVHSITFSPNGTVLATAGESARGGHDELNLWFAPDDDEVSARAR